MWRNLPVGCAAVVLLPVNPIAPRAVLPEDPAVALALAMELLDGDRLMANHAFGLWGYTGTAPDGLPLTVQATGLGGPSAAVVLGDLADHGVRCAVAVTPGGPAAVTAIRGTDGASRAVGAAPALDDGLTAALLHHTGAGVEVTSGDLPPGDLRTAALAATATARGVRFAAVLADDGAAALAALLAAG
jgi:hypothetical protein